MLVQSLLRLALLGASWVMYLLIVLSVISIAVMIERWWWYLRNTERESLGSVVHGFLASGDFDGLTAALAKRTTVEADILERAMAFVPAGARAFEHAVRAEMDKRRSELNRGLNFLGTVGSNAPFVGLLGTVIGVIEAFHNLGAGNDDAAMAAVMAGIAEALIATAVGLFVAIPAVVGYNVFSSRVEGIEENLDGLVKTICADLEASDRGVSVRRGKPVASEPPTPARAAEARDEEDEREEAPPASSAVAAD
jgi:biopolymer transport protein ExbB/biopolymer transport protein TolQ